MSSWILSDGAVTQTVNDGNTVTITGGTGITSTVSATDTVTLVLDNTSVTPASYGSATEVGTFTVDQQGRLTAAANAAITYPFSTFSIATDPATATQAINDGNTVTFEAGTFITPVVAATRKVTSDLSATGTPSAATFLRGDNTWSTPAGGFSNFDISDGAITETINSGETITFTGGTALTSVVSAVDTVTYNLDNTAVAAGSYTYSSLTVDAQGRLTSASSGAAPGTMSTWTLSGDSGVNQTISDGDTVDIEGGTGISTVAAATDKVTITLDDTVVTPGSYTYSAITVDQQGRLTSAASGAAPGTMSSWILSDGVATQTVADGNTVTITGGTGLTSTVSATDTVTLVLDDTAVTPASYGSGTQVSTFTVDQQGRLTAAANAAITYPFTNFSIATDPATGIESVNDGETVTFEAGTFITPVVAATRKVTADLSATGTPDATKFLRGDNSWATPAGGGTMSSWDLAGDSGPSQTVSDTNTVTIAGGTALSSVASATDTVTLNLDDTAVTPAL